MGTYEIIKDLQENDRLNLFLRKGIIPLSIIDYKNIYEFYVSELCRNKKMQSIENTCEKFKCKKDKVYFSIKKMES